MHERYEVAVAGMGPAGAVCAGLLGKLGVRTLALERSRELYDKPRAFALDHEVMRVFQNLGIAERVLPYTAPFTPSEYYGADGRLIKRLGAVPPPYPLAWTPSMVFRQPQVEAILREGVAAIPDVDVRYGMSLEDFSQDATGVALSLVDDRGARREVRANYLVACDGAASGVRRSLGIGHEDMAFDEPWLVVDVLVNEAGAAKLPQVSIQYCEPARPCTYLIGTGEHRRWEIMLLPGEDPRAMEDEAAVWKLLSRWLSPADAKLWRQASYRFHALAASEWRRGRVFLAGDAAHQQPPFTGQGMCQGIRDVANLSWKLKLALDGAPDALLDTYQQERLPHVRRLTGVVKGIGRLICERDPAAARVRDDRLVDAAGGEVRTEPRQNLIPPLEAGFLSPEPHAANGTLFPQPRLRRRDGVALLDDVAGSGFRLFVRGPMPTVPAALLERLDIQLVRIEPAEELDGVLASWFARHACSAVLVRPDHYVYGVAAHDGDAAKLVESAVAFAAPTGRAQRASK
jgi:3-(3-hydroxy-phenyl)propionate hydroxylase